jgi:hypothetical protein
MTEKKNILVENKSRTPSISAKSGKLYTMVAVEINLETGAVRTNPYLTGTGDNRDVNTGFGTNSFEDEAEPEPSGGHGGHSG